MRIHVACPKCSKAYVVEDHLLGKSSRCKQCGETFKLTSPEEADKIQTTAKATMSERSAKTTPRAGNGSLDHLARFQIRARLGAGAFGTVYRAFDPQLEREVALKVPQAGVLDSPKRVERFLREAKSAAQLRHPNIVPIYDAGQENGNHYIASAFIEGHTLADVIDERGMNITRAATIVLHLAEALAYAHNLGIVHRDIKPANVMIDEEDQPHLMDFGLAARTESTEKLTQDGAVLGTPAYMAPEHAAGHSGDAFPASDQYSLGVVLYELLTGKTPWEGPPQVVLYNVIHKEPPRPRSLRKDIPRDLETICLKAMAKQSEHRFRDCQAMADDLRRFLEGEPVKARRPGFGERMVRWMKREPKIAAAGLLALIGTITLAAGLGLLAQKLQGDFDSEQTAHGKTKKTLTEEQADHLLTKGDRYAKQVGLALEKIEGHDLPGAMHTLVSCPPDLRAWEWGHLRQLAEGSPDAMHVLRGKGKVLHLQFSGDSKQMLSQHPEGLRMVWDLASLKSQDEKQALALNEWSPMKFSDDGRLVATLQIAPFKVPEPGQQPKFDPCKLKIQEVATNKLVQEITIPGGMNVVGLSPDGAKVAVAHADKFSEPLKLTIYDVQTGQEAQKLDGEFSGVIDLVFCHDNTMLAVVQGGGMVVEKKKVSETVSEIVDGKPVERTVYKEVEVTMMKGSGSGVKVIELATGKEQLAVTKDAVGLSRAVFAPDCKRLYYLHADGVEVYNLADGKELFTLRGCTGAVAFSPDGKRIATASGQNACPPDGLIKLWDAATGRFVVAVRTKGYTMAFDRLLFSPDGARLAAVPAHGSEIFLFSTSGGRLLTPYYEHGVPVASVTWSPDGKLLSSWSDCNQTARVWDAADGKTQLVAPSQFGAGLGFSTDTKYLSTGGGCLGAVPQGFGGHGMHGGYGAYGGGGGCYGMQAFGSVNAFSVSGFKAMPAPKGYDAILAASKQGKNWILRPTFDSKGKVFSADQAPRPRLWNVADEKEAIELGELNMDSEAEFTDDGSRIVGIGKGPATTTGHKTEYRIEKKVRKITVKKDGKDVEVTQEYDVKVPVLVPYQISVFTTRLKLLDATTGKKMWQSYGVHDLFAVSGDGKLVATLPPPVPRQVPGVEKMMPPSPKEGIKIPAPVPKEAPKKTLSVPQKTARVGAPGSASDVERVGDAPQALLVAQHVPPVQFISFQEPKKVPAQPAPAPKGPGEPGIDMPPMPRIPSPPITLWVVDEKDKDGQPVRRMLDMPGEVTMMKFSPDGKYLAAFVPRVLEQVPETHTRKVFFDIDGQRVVKDEAYTVMTKRQYSLLMVFDTATGKEIVRHVGASGLAVFCNGSGHIASAAGLPKFESMHGGGVAPMNHDEMPQPAPKKMPAPEKKLVSAPRFAEPALLGLAPRKHVQVASLGQEIVQAPAADDEFEPVGWDGPGMHGPHGGPPHVDTTLVVFDLKTGERSHEFRGHSSQVTTLAFSPDCQLLASGSYGDNPWSCFDPPGKYNAQINIWNLKTKKLFQSISGHTGKINCMEFDPEGKRLASASDDTTVMVWRVEASLNTSTPGYAVPAPAYATPGIVIQPAQPAPVAPTPPTAAPKVNVSSLEPNLRAALWAIRTGADVRIRAGDDEKEVKKEADLPKEKLTVVAFQRGEAPITDADLANLDNLSELGSLRLQDTKVTDAGMQILTRLPKIGELWLDNTAITSATLEHIKGLKGLESLSLNETKVSDAGLANFKQLPALQGLGLNRTAVTDAGLEYVKGVTNLRELGLKHTAITDRGLETIRGLKLGTLHLGGNKITDAGVAHLAKMTSLHELRLHHAPLTDSSLDHLKGMTELRFLVLDNTKITDAGLAKLKDLKNLTGLGIGGTQVTDAGLMHLKALTQLRALNVEDSKVTEAGIANLKAALPKCEIGGRWYDH